MARDNKTIPAPTGFFRFIVVSRVGSKEKRLGILRSAGRLQNAKKTTYDDERLLNDLIWWFNKNLDAPRRLDRAAAIFWFKPHVAGETELWRKLTELVDLLRKYSVQVDMLETTRPGKIIYDDERQIAAVPFNDTFLETA